MGRMEGMFCTAVSTCPLTSGGERGTCGGESELLLSGMPCFFGLELRLLRDNKDGCWTFVA